MSSYHYRCRKYTKKPSPVMRVMKELANRVLEATSGGHPGGAEALVDKMVEQYPEKPKQPAEAPVTDGGKKDGIE
jgi:hypothetical protein